MWHITTYWYRDHRTTHNEWCALALLVKWGYIQLSTVVLSLRWYYCAAYVVTWEREGSPWTRDKYVNRTNCRKEIAQSNFYRTILGPRDNSSRNAHRSKLRPRATKYPTLHRRNTATVCYCVQKGAIQLRLKQGTFFAMFLLLFEKSTWYNSTANNKKKNKFIPV